MTWKTVLAFLKLIHGLKGRNSWTEVLNFIHLSCRTPQISLGSRIIIKFSVLTETSLQFFPMCLRLSLLDTGSGLVKDNLTAGAQRAGEPSTALGHLRRQSTDPSF